MDVVTGAMATLLPKLGDLLAEEYQLQASVRDDITFLKSELSSMEAALLRLSEAPLDRPPDAQDRLWAREVRDLTYDIEDCVEAFLLRLGHHAPPKNGDDGLQLQGGLRGFIDRGLGLLKRAKICRDMGADVRSIKRRIVEVGERRVRYKVDGSVADANPDGLTVDSLRLSALYAEKAELVGTGERIDELVRMLLDQEGHETLRRRLKVVSIVGFGGLGKTTLAKIVFDKLKGQFDCAAFVTISLNPNMEKVLRNMLCQLDTSFNANSAMCGEAQAINELREFLRNKRYLIVIDDIWSYSVWNTVKYALIENECGSRIITTTRILDVAKQASASVYLLKPLSLADSRKLFYHRVFGTEDICPPNQLAEVSENILKKCGGVPLAVIAIASLLANKRRKDNTEKFWYQVYQSMGSGLEQSTGVKNMRRILSISYYDLPPNLKTCLLYLTLYSEDYGIMREEVIYKWIGEGFVHKQHGKTLYEVGEEYYEDLISKSMIQPMLYDRGNKVWSCCVHDMMLDLITSLSEEDNFLKALGGSRPISGPSKIRRLSLQNIKGEDIKQVGTMNLSHLRSLIVSPETFTLLPALSSFPVVRVLDLCGCSQVDNNHCKHICNLFHLRYLKLSWTSITEIPDEIGNLQLLQFLDLNKTNIKELPSTFIQLRKIEFLCVDNRTRLPEHLGNLISLQKLSPHIAIRSPTMLRDLSRLTELRCLLVRFNEWDESYEEPFVHCLSSLVNLDSLHIFDCHNGLSSGIGILTPGPQKLQSINIGPGTIRRVPRWISSLSALSALDITLLTLGEEDLQILGSVPSLRNLYVWVKDHRKDRDKRLVIGSDHPFRCLTRFRIGRGAMEVEFAQEAMLKLQTLRLDFHVRHTMDQFGDFVFGLENLSSLEHVIVHMNCYYAELGEVEDAEASIQKALNLNPKRPTFELEKMEDIAAKERALEILTVEYPRFTALLEEIRTAYSPQVAAPSLEVINVNICVRDVKADKLGIDFGLGNLSSLKGIKAHIDCYMCFPTEVQEVESELRHAVEIHPNRPILEIIRYWEDEMADSDSRMLERQQKLRWIVLWGRGRAHADLYKSMLCEVGKMGNMKTDLNLGDANNKLQKTSKQAERRRRHTRRKVRWLRLCAPLERWRRAAGRGGVSKLRRLRQGASSKPRRCGRAGRRWRDARDQQ